MKQFELSIPAQVWDWVTKIHPKNEHNFTIEFTKQKK